MASFGHAGLSRLWPSWKQPMTAIFFLTFLLASLAGQAQAWQTEGDDQLLALTGRAG